MQQQLCLPLLHEFSITVLHATNFSIRNVCAAMKFSNLKCSSKPDMLMQSQAQWKQTRKSIPHLQKAEP